MRETCNIPILTMAAWLLCVSLVVAKGEELSGRAPAAAAFRVVGHEVLMNGEPYVPFGLVDHCQREEYRRFKTFGINSVSIDSLFKNVQPDGSMEKEIERLRADLDEAQKNGLTVLVLLGGAAPPDWLFERYPNCRMKKADGSDQMKFTWTQYTLNHPGIRKELEHYFGGVVNLADFFRWQARIIRDIDPHHIITTKIRKPLDLRDDSAGQRAVNTRMWAESFSLRRRT